MYTESGGRGKVEHSQAEAIGLMRELRRKPAAGEWVSLSGADPGTTGGE